MTTENTDLLAGALNDPNAGVDHYAELVGDGKKFKDNSALAKGKVEADKMITTLTSEAKELRDEIARLKSAKPGEDAVKSLIERIEKSTDKNGQPAAALAREDIEKLVREGINANDTERAKRGNYLLANAELNNHFKGDAATAAKHLTDRMGELGMNAEAVKQIAEANPKVFKQLFVPSSGHRPVDSSMPASRSGLLPDVGGEERGAKYYSKMRKDMGAKFWEPAVQQQRMKDRERLGERFNTL